MHDKRKAAHERPWEKPGDYLKNTEIAMEGNANMVDGIINNTMPGDDDLTDGQTFDEIKNLAPETLPEAEQNKRPSVKELLKAPSVRIPAARAKAQPRHGMEPEL